MTATVKHTIRISLELDKRIRVVAASKKWKLNTLMTEALDRYVEAADHQPHQQPPGQQQ